MYSTIYKYTVNAVTTAPLHIGAAVGEAGEVLINPVSGNPFIQASSIVGVLRTVSEKINGSAVTAKLFGNARSSDAGKEESDGCLKFSDADFYPETVKMELRPRVKINPDTGTVSAEKVSGSSEDSGQKFETEYIGEEAQFYFTIYLFTEKVIYVNELEKVIKGLSDTQIGGQKSNGAGFVKLSKVLRREFDLTTDAGLNEWLENSEDDCGEVKDFTNIDPDSKWYVITVSGKTEGEILVKSSIVEGFGEDAPDAINIKNASDKYIIPGSSFKGALRNRVSYITGKLNKKDLTEDIFGHGTGSGANPSGASRGKVVVRDILIDVSQCSKEYIQHRIHIDKFTAGVMQGQKFSESPIGGSLEITIAVEDFENAKAAVGLIILAIRDLANGFWNIGSGYNIGRGFVKVDTLAVETPGCNGEKKVIHFNTENNNPDDIREISDVFMKAIGEAKVEHE